MEKSCYAFFKCNERLMCVVLVNKKNFCILPKWKNNSCVFCFWKQIVFCTVGLNRIHNIYIFISQRKWQPDTYATVVEKCLIIPTYKSGVLAWETFCTICVIRWHVSVVLVSLLLWDFLFNPSSRHFILLWDCPILRLSLFFITCHWDPKSPLLHSNL